MIAEEKAGVHGGKMLLSKYSVSEFWMNYTFSISKMLKESLRHGLAWILIDKYEEI